MGRLFSARVRKNPPASLSLKNSTLRKVNWRTQKQAGNKLLRTHPLPSQKTINDYERQKQGRRLMRAFVTRALDRKEIYAKQTRANIQRAMQAYFNGKTEIEKHKAVEEIFRELKSGKAYREFFEELFQAQLENLSR